MPFEKDSLAKKLVSKKEIEEEVFPLLPSLIQRCQLQDRQLQKVLSCFKDSKDLGAKNVEGHKLVTYKGRVYLPVALRSRVVAWYHEYLSHPGQTRMERTLAQTLYWPKMATDIQKFVKTCKTCQVNKGPRKEYGLLPPKQWDQLKPWQRVDIDMIGPFKVKTPTKELELRALTMINPCTGTFVF